MSNEVIKGAAELTCNLTLKEAQIFWFTLSQKTTPYLYAQIGVRNLILTMTECHGGKPHTTIADQLPFLQQ